MATQHSQTRVRDSNPIPDRLYFKIGDVARICDVETYVLRFWESQFPQLKPNKSGTGQRLYRRRDVEVALEIRDLVHGQGYTLSGARQALGNAKDQAKRPQSLSQNTNYKQVARDSQSRLPLTGSEAAGRLEAVARAVGQARVELREIAALLALPEPRTPRRRVRHSGMQEREETLFPA
jgi:DNA-binding transcriptional MerR regulator